MNGEMEHFLHDCTYSRGSITFIPKETVIKYLAIVPGSLLSLVMSFIVLFIVPVISDHSHTLNVRTNEVWTSQAHLQ